MSLPNQVGEDPTLFNVANALLKRWRLIFMFPVGFAFLSITVALLLPARWIAYTTFVSESQSDGIRLPGGLAGLASSLGVGLPGGSGTPPQFFVDVMKSATIRNSVLLHEFDNPSGTQGPTSSLLDLLEVKGDNEPERLEKGRELLGETVTIGYEVSTSIIVIGAETTSPQLSADVANYFVELIEEFNLGTRQTAARYTREFLEGRMEEARTELASAEDLVAQFLNENRQWESSPRLQFDHDRLQRQVRIKEEVVTTLNSQFEEARIQEVNDTPAITVIDRANPPVEKSKPRRRMIVMVATFLGLLIGVFLALFGEFLEQSSASDSADFRELQARWGRFKVEFRSLFRASKSGV